MVVTLPASTINKTTPANSLCQPARVKIIAVSAVLLLVTIVLSTYDFPRAVTSRLSPPTQSAADRPAPRDLRNLKYPRGRVQDAFTVGRLSHLSFHLGSVKDILLRLATRSARDAVVVVGVAGGGEVIGFAKTHRVFAFEAIKQSVDRFRRRIQTGDYDVTVYNIAVTENADPNATLQIKYKDKTSTVPTGRIQDYVPRSIDIAVMSVDIQGTEWAAIKGAKALLPRVQSLWIEISCRPDTLEMLQYLDRDYVIFDFVPWGYFRNDSMKVFEPRHASSFVYDPKRPGTFKAYLDWFCDAANRYKWLQTDIVALRRDLFEGSAGRELEKGLSSIHIDGCTEKGTCVLQEVLSR